MSDDDDGEEAGGLFGPGVPLAEDDKPALKPLNPPDETWKARRAPRPKYQVFVSSTYSDLKDERERVTWEILKARQIPAGMENFSAANDRGWETIQRVIDLSDYYVVILAGRYGSMDRGVSWTEREFKYAVSKGIPVLGFIRKSAHITDDKAEQDAGVRKKLQSFKARLKNRYLVEEWADGNDLAAKVAQALQNQIRNDEDDDRARPGWYRGDKLYLGPAVAEEIARLSAQNESLRGEVESLRESKTVILEAVDESGCSGSRLSA